MPNTIASTDVGGTGLATVGTNGQVLTSNGTTLSWQTPSAGTSFSAGTTGFTPNTATTGTVTLAGTLGTANGGTNLTSFTSGGALYATSTSALTTGTLPVTAGGTGLTTLTSGYIPYGNGTSALSSSANLTFNGSTLFTTQFYQKDTAAAGYITQVLENTNATGYVQFYLNVGASAANGQSTISYAPGIFFAMGPSANDTTTPIVFRNNNATERVRITSAGGVSFGATGTAYGTAGQFLQSNGNAPPTWGPATSKYLINYAVQAGGGGGAGTNGGNMGGGGGGGLLQGSVTLTAGAVYTATVGGGGAYGNSPGNGGDSSLIGTSVSLTATGGGAGSSRSAQATNGGCGGGAGEVYPLNGLGVVGQGWPGGMAQNGAGAAGGGGTGGWGSSTGNGSVGSGLGGIGVYVALTGAAIMLGAGGGASQNGQYGGWPNGGAGSGGPGAYPYSPSGGTNGQTNTGMGGGGSYSSTPGNGGSGTVIIAIPTAGYTGTYTGSPTVSTNGSYTVLRFTGTGTYTA